MIVFVADPMLSLSNYAGNFMYQYKWTVDSGFIPVVDMLNFKSAVRPDNLYVNAWELYYEQPFGYSLDDISRAKRVRYIRKTEQNQSYQAEYPLALFKEWVRPNDTIQPIIDNMHENPIYKKEHISVIARGTDYRIPNQGMPHAEIEELMEEVDVWVAKYGIKDLFVATEDAEYFEKLKSRYGEHMCYVEDFRTRMKGDSFFVAQQWKRDGIDLIEKNRNYLATLYLLAESKNHHF